MISSEYNKVKNINSFYKLKVHLYFSLKEYKDLNTDIGDYLMIKIKLDFWNYRILLKII